MKSLVVKEIFLWLKIKCKKQKEKVDAAALNYENTKKYFVFDDEKECVDYALLQLEREKAKLEMLVEIKIGVEKYMRKYRHIENRKE